MNAINPRRDQPRRIDRPEPGFFRLRLVRRGPWVGADIRYALGLWSASINGVPCGAHHPDPVCATGVFRIWESAERITGAEYDALIASPPVSPELSIDLGAMPPITWEEPAMNAISHLSNAPIVDLHTALEPAALAAWLSYQYATHEGRKDELLDANRRFIAATAAGITTDAVAERATDFARQLKVAIKQTDEQRVGIKAPVLAAQRAIDGAAKAITDPLLAASVEAERRVTGFLRAKDAEARRVAAEAAARAEEAAWHLSEAAESTNDADAFDQAGEAIEQQQAAEAIVFAPTADLTRLRTALGGTSSLRDRWTYTVTDLSAVPAHFLCLNEAAVKAAIKGGTRSIPGIRITNEPRVGIR